MTDPYERLAYDYDEFGDISDYLGDEKDFFETLFKKHGVRSVLDCACGTGQHLYMMLRLGLAVEGSDYSASMLEVAKKNLVQAGAEIALKQCDFRFLETKFGNTFDAVVCLTNALPHLHTDDDLVMALKSMRSRLNDGGILVLTSGTTPYTLAKTPPIEVVVNKEDFSRVFVKESKDGFLTIHILDLFHSAKRTESNQYDIVNKILLDSDYKRLLEHAGYSCIHIYGDYQSGEYESVSSRRIIVVGEK